MRVTPGWLIPGFDGYLVCIAQLEVRSEHHPARTALGKAWNRPAPGQIGSDKATRAYS